MLWHFPESSHLLPLDVKILKTKGNSHVARIDWARVRSSTGFVSQFSYRQCVGDMERLSFEVFQIMISAL